MIYKAHVQCYVSCRGLVACGEHRGHTPRISLMAFLVRFSAIKLEVKSLVAGFEMRFRNLLRYILAALLTCTIVKLFTHSSRPTESAWQNETFLVPSRLPLT